MAANFYIYGTRTILTKIRYANFETTPDIRAISFTVFADIQIEILFRMKSFAPLCDFESPPQRADGSVLRPNAGLWKKFPQNIFFPPDEYFHSHVREI